MIVVRFTDPDSFLEECRLNLDRVSSRRRGGKPVARVAIKYLSGGGLPTQRASLEACLSLHFEVYLLSHQLGELMGGRWLSEEHQSLATAWVDRLRQELANMGFDVRGGLVEVK